MAEPAALAMVEPVLADMAEPASSDKPPSSSPASSDVNYASHPETSDVAASKGLRIWTCEDHFFHLATEIAIGDPIGVQQALELCGEANVDLNTFFKTVTLSNGQEVGSPLGLAAGNYPDIQIVELLLKAGADPNVPTGDMGLTPLHYAVNNGASMGVVKLLLEAGGDPNMQETSGMTALHRAVFHNPTEMVQATISKGQQVSSPLGHAEDNSHELRIVELLLKAGADPNVLPEAMGVTPLHYAVNNRARMGVVKLLLEAGGDPNRPETESGMTTLHRAVLNNSTEMVQVLLDAGADVTAVDKRKWTPLTYSSSTERFGVHPDICKLLAAALAARAGGLKEKVRRGEEACAACGAAAPGGGGGGGGGGSSRGGGQGGEAGLKLKKCAGCKSIFYCSAACQKEDWKQHKRDCKQAQEIQAAVMRLLEPDCGIEGITQILEFAKYQQDLMARLNIVGMLVAAVPDDTVRHTGGAKLPQTKADGEVLAADPEGPDFKEGPKPLTGETAGKGKKGNRRRNGKSGGSEEAGENDAEGGGKEGGGGSDEVMRPYLKTMCALHFVVSPGKDEEEFERYNATQAARTITRQLIESRGLLVMLERLAQPDVNTSIMRTFFFNFLRQLLSVRPIIHAKRNTGILAKMHQRGDFPAFLEKFVAVLNRCEGDFVLTTHLTRMLMELCMAEMYMCNKDNERRQDGAGATASPPVPPPEGCPRKHSQTPPELQHLPAAVVGALVAVDWRKLSAAYHAAMLKPVPDGQLSFFERLPHNIPGALEWIIRDPDVSAALVETYIIASYFGPDPWFATGLAFLGHALRTIPGFAVGYLLPALTAMPNRCEGQVPASFAWSRGVWCMDHCHRQCKGRLLMVLACAAQLNGQWTARSPVLLGLDDNQKHDNLENVADLLSALSIPELRAVVPELSQEEVQAAKRLCSSNRALGLLAQSSLVRRHAKLPSAVRGLFIALDIPIPKAFRRLRSRRT